MGLRERGLSVPYLLQREKTAVTGWPTVGYHVLAHWKPRGLPWHSRTWDPRPFTDMHCAAAEWTGEKATSYPESLTKSPQICQEYIHSFLKASHRGLALKAYNTFTVTLMSVSLILIHLRHHWDKSDKDQLCKGDVLGLWFLSIFAGRSRSQADQKYTQIRFNLNWLLPTRSHSTPSLHAFHSRGRRGEQLHLCVLHMPGIFFESSSSVGKSSFIFITCTVSIWSHYIGPVPTIVPTFIFTVIWSEIQIKKANELRGGSMQIIFFLPAGLQTYPGPSFKLWRDFTCPLHAAGPSPSVSGCPGW